MEVTVTIDHSFAQSNRITCIKFIRWFMQKNDKYMGLIDADRLHSSCLYDRESCVITNEFSQLRASLFMTGRVGRVGRTDRTEVIKDRNLMIRAIYFYLEHCGLTNNAVVEIEYEQIKNIDEFEECINV